MASDRRVVDADRLFYHYLQKDLLESDVWLFQMLTARLVVSLGVWFSPAVYDVLPVMLPFAVRDPASRGNKAAGLPDSWGAPNERGLFRDDNSLVKSLPRALGITSARNRQYHGHRLGRGFVASHVWRELPDGSLASRNPETYSFVPNLVWLPSQVAALTDREGSFVQSYVQALAMKIYKHRAVATEAKAVAERAWSKLPDPPPIPEQGLPSIDELNFFAPTPAWYERRFGTIRTVVSGLNAVAAGSPISSKVISSRYTEGLSGVSVQAALALKTDLERHLGAWPQDQPAGSA